MSSQQVPVCDWGNRCAHEIWSKEESCSYCQGHETRGLLTLVFSYICVHVVLFLLYLLICLLLYPNHLDRIQSTSEISTVNPEQYLRRFLDTLATIIVE